MDQEAKGGVSNRDEGSVTSQEAQTASPEKRTLAEAMRLGDILEGPTTEVITKTAKDYPEVTVKKVYPNYRLHAGQWDPGITVDLSGPKTAVMAFLAHLGLILNPTSLQVLTSTGQRTGGTGSAPVRQYQAIFMNPGLNPDR